VGKKLAERIKKAVSALTDGVTKAGNIYDYSSKEGRERTVTFLYDYAKTYRTQWVELWRMYDDYVEGKHKTQLEIQESCEKAGIPWIPAIIPDPWIQVESQIIPDIPDFEFNGRDDDLDSQKAKQREFVVKYVVENNKLNAMNTMNERRLNKLGNAFWKVAWDGRKEAPGKHGDIVIGDPDCATIFPDPAAIDIDDCEFIDYAYRVHKNKAARAFREELKALEITINEIGLDGNHSDTQIYNSKVHELDDDTVQIIEHWFRQLEDGNDTYEYEIFDELRGKPYTVSQKVKYEAGDIACSILINDTEVKYIPKYWIKTGKQNKMYPFVKYCKIPDENNFWDKSELKPILDLVDAADRELAIALLNDAFMGNDIIISEENAFADDGTHENRPGAEWKMKTGMLNSVRRLSGLGQPSNRLEMINFLRGVIQETVGNFDSAQGKEPVRVTTASGIAQLNERADARKNIKKADRLAGFERLYELIDWTALEFYDDDRLIFIGVKDDETRAKFSQGLQGIEGLPMNLDINQGPVIFKFNSDKMRVLDNDTTETADEAQYYYPRVDAVVNAGDGLNKSKAFTLASTENLLKLNITPQNYKIVIAMVDIMDLPNRKEIREHLETMYAPQPPQPAVEEEQPLNVDDILSQLTPEEIQALEENPELLDDLMQGDQI
jgi:hypothetical protein